MQMWNIAFDNKLVNVQPPRRKTLNLPVVDNERTRAFTLDEAKKFFECIKAKSQLWHDISLLSLLTGLRASEIYRLQLSDIDFLRGLLFLRTPKKARSQHLQISDAAQSQLRGMLKLREEILEEKDDLSTDLLVFRKDGTQITEVSDSIERVICDLGFNKGVEKKARLTFHSLRHTTATWLLEEGEDIYRVSKVLRHTTVRMTEQRYAHLSNDTIKRTADVIGNVLAYDGADDESLTPDTDQKEAN
jgi:integrase